jgi:integrase/recombinase XerD
MNKLSLINQVFPQNSVRYSSLPIVGSLVEDFAQWLQALTYSRNTIRRMIQGLHPMVLWLRRRRRVACIAEMTPEVLAAADAHFRRRQPYVSHAGNALHRFLRQRQAIPEPKPGRRSPSQKEAERFAVHLREVRGLAEKTVRKHTRLATRFLEFLGFNRRRSRLRQLRRDQTERFLRYLARTHNHLSLIEVVVTLRAFLRFEFSQGVLPRPLHEQIDTPRVYPGERLPRALAWGQVRALLRSVDQAGPNGLRDFTMLYLAAVYGLRCSELVHLRLEDIQWRNTLLQVNQAKTKQVLQLPLTDEAGEVLARYLREARPSTERRELFLHARAPRGPLHSSAVTEMLKRRLQRSGLKLDSFGAHALRHSLAVHLLRRGVSVKSIGDTLGHRDVRSTALYLRLNLDDLRSVALPVPKSAPAVRLLGRDWRVRFPRVRLQTGARPPSPPRLRSAFGPAIKQYLDLRRSFGLKWVMEEHTLRAWDAFLHRQQAKALNREWFCLWAKSLLHLKPTVQRQRLCCVRRLLVYCARQHPRCFIPDVADFPKALPPGPPRLVSTAEMACLLATAAQLERSNDNPLRAQTIQVGLLLLFGCGLRSGELLRLQLRHYDAAEQLLRIEASKFNKSRLVPLARSVAQALQRYLVQRCRHGIPSQPESVLMWSGYCPEPKAAYTSTGLTTTWKHLCLSAGVIDERGRPPRLHDLRHSFAVEALHRWYEQGVNVQSRLPHLAAYLGHVNASSSHYYLKLTPALRSAASQRFHRAFGHLTQTGGTV